MSEMTKTIKITLPHDVAHLIEVQAAKDNLRLADSIEKLLCFMAANLKARREVAGNA
jgi:hypothetical protein